MFSIIKKMKWKVCIKYFLWISHYSGCLKKVLVWLFERQAELVTFFMAHHFLHKGITDGKKSRLYWVRVLANIWLEINHCPYNSFCYKDENPSPVYLPNPGIERVSPVSPSLAGKFFTAAPPGKPTKNKPAPNVNSVKVKTSSSLVRGINRFCDLKEKGYIPGALWRDHLRLSLCTSVQVPSGETQAKVGVLRPGHLNGFHLCLQRQCNSPFREAVSVSCW